MMPLNSQTALLFLLTPMAFFMANALYQHKKQHVLLQPLLIGVVLVFISLWAFDITYIEYMNSNQLFKWLLGPAVVSLAIPLYQNLSHIKQWLPSVLATICIAASISVLISWLLSHFLKIDNNTQIALFTKSATTPIALSINEILNGHKALAATIVMFTGLAGAIFGPALLNLVGITDHRIKGIALGLTSHAIGTQKAFDISPICGAFAALGMVLTGLFLAIALPWFTDVIKLL